MRRLPRSSKGNTRLALRAALENLKKVERREYAQQKKVTATAAAATLLILLAALAGLIFPLFFNSGKPTDAEQQALRIKINELASFSASLTNEVADANARLARTELVGPGFLCPCQGISNLRFQI